MSNKTCLQCKHYFPPTTKCPRYAESFSCSEKACVSFEQDPDMEKKPPTVFQQITASPEVLAHTYIYTVLSTDNEVFFCSALLSPTQTFVHLDEAIAATVAKLGEVCDD